MYMGVSSVTVLGSFRTDYGYCKVENMFWKQQMIKREDECVFHKKFLVVLVAIVESNVPYYVSNNRILVNAPPPPLPPLLTKVQFIPPLENPAQKQPREL